MKHVFSLLVLCSPILPNCLSAQDQLLTKLISTNQQFWEVPGVTVIRVTRDQIVDVTCVGDISLNGPKLTPQAIFPIASCTKQFTCFLLGQLVDDGLLNWDDPVQQHLPWFKLTDAAATKLVTVRDLLCHRTGVPGHDILWYQSTWSAEEIVRRGCQMPLTQPFRTTLQYSSIMYLAAGLIAEKVTQQPWGTLIEDRIFKPVRLKTATVIQPTAGQVSGHRLSDDGKLKPIPYYEMKTPNAAGSIHMTANDIGAWLKLLLNEGKRGDEAIISQQSFRELFQPQTIIRREGITERMNPHTSQLAYGLGWVIQDYRGHRVCQHAGFIEGTRVHFTLLPDDNMAFAILSNREGSRLPLSLSNQLIDHHLKVPKSTDWNKLFHEIVAEEELALQVNEKRIELARRPNTTPTRPLTDFVGQYEHPAYGRITIQHNQGQLICQWNHWKLPLSHWDTNTFRIDSTHPLFRTQFIPFQVTPTTIPSLRFQGLEFMKQRD